MCHDVHVEDRGQFGEVGSLLHVGPTDQAQMVRLGTSDFIHGAILSAYIFREGQDLAI